MLSMDSGTECAHLPRRVCSISAVGIGQLPMSAEVFRVGPRHRGRNSRRRRRMLAWMRGRNSPGLRMAARAGYIRTLPSSLSVQPGLCAISHT
jgi:hypothetical protein